MWSSLDRTRRRLLGTAPADDASQAFAAAEDEARADVEAGLTSDLEDDVILVLGRPELDRLGTALVALLGPATVRPDTPARLEAALDAAVVALGEPGVVRVDRRPAGLYTPESWQVRLMDVPTSTIEAIRHATREGAFR
jgi:hypothetical protein